MQTFLITGATSGIGRHTALALARQDARLLIVGRDPQRTAANVKELQQQSGNSRIEGLLADLSRQSEVRALAEQVKERTDSLDLLLNNAGTVFARRRLSPDGFEQTWAVNHLAYFLLTRLLLDPLRASPAARIVNVASRGHFDGRINWDDLTYARGYSEMKAYCQSKLANVMFTYALARRLEGSSVTVNALHPGVVATNIWSGAPLWTQPLLALFKLGMISPEKGAETSIFLATSAEVAGISGQYFDTCRACRSSSSSYDVPAQERLWELSSRQTGLEPGSQ
ncbi:MAG TPA: SDR family oxidoreductase [Candidatus Obscuribacterales bacterium]